MASFPKGFTLLELTLSISLIAVLAVITLPMYRSFQQTNSLDVAAQTLVQSMHRAQLLAQSGSHDSDWGVKLEAGSVTIFSGSSFAARNIDLDEVFDLSTAIEFEGLDEVVFSSVFGEPQQTGSLQLADRIPHYRVLRINSEGVIDY